MHARMNEAQRPTPRDILTTRRGTGRTTKHDAWTGAVLSRVRVQNVREREVDDDDDDAVDVPARGGDADDGARGDDARERRGR